MTPTSQKYSTASLGEARIIDIKRKSRSLVLIVPVFTSWMWFSWQTRPAQKQVKHHNKPSANAPLNSDSFAQSSYPSATAVLLWASGCHPLEFWYHSLLWCVRVALCAFSFHPVIVCWNQWTNGKLPETLYLRIARRPRRDFLIVMAVR